MVCLMLSCLLSCLLLWRCPPATQPTRMLGRTAKTATYISTVQPRWQLPPPSCLSALASSSSCLVLMCEPIAKGAQPLHCMLRVVDCTTWPSIPGVVLRVSVSCMKHAVQRLYSLFHRLMREANYVNTLTTSSGQPSRQAQHSSAILSCSGLMFKIFPHAPLGRV